MLFGILGPLLAGNDDTVAVTAGRDRAVLATLLLRAGRVVPVDDLIAAMWDGTPPGSARGQLQSCVSRLRRALADAGAAPDLLATDPAGYVLRPAPDDLDAAVFDRLHRAARAAQADGRLDEAADRYRAALDLWRGPALAGLVSRAVRAGATALDEERLRVFEAYADVQLRLGRHRELAGELAEMVDRHPLRERLREQLMVALHRAGRRAEALAAYRDARAVLADELGIEPGQALQDIHRQVLADEPEPSSAPAATALRPRCLPRAVADFTGREYVLAQLVKDVDAAEPDRPVVLVIDGMGGSGKTALAVHLANAVGARYPDAHLFVDLHGHSERRPLEPGAALITLLRQLGVPSEQIPADYDDRVARWRSELANRRAIVVLDNASRTAQVVPLLPGGGAGTLVLVTSRRRLVGLDGVHPVSLPLLDPTEAVELLARIAGPERVAAEPRAAQEVVRRCGYLPLAVRLAAARLAHRPRWRIADLAERLDEQRAALPELTADDRSVAEVFALSYEQLAPIVRWTFRALALHPGEQFDALAVAALVDLRADDATDALDELIDQHLVEEPSAGRYRMHDLVREYATGLVAADSQAVRAAAVGRLLDHHLHATLKGSTGLQYVRPIEGLTEPLRPDLLEGMPANLEWAERERPNLLPLLRRAVAYGHLRLAWQLARAQWPFLYVHEYLDDLVAAHLIALEAARVEGDRRGVATTYNYLASAYFRTSRNELAIEALLEALRIRDELGDVVGTGIVRGNLAVALMSLGRLAEAWDHARRAAATWRGTAGPYPYPPSITQLAVLNGLFGRYEDALRYQRWQVQIAAERKDFVRLGTGLSNVAYYRLRLGHLGPAERLLRAAIALSRRHRNAYVEIEALCRLGIALRLRGRLGEAESCQRESLRISRDVGDRRAEVAARTELGITLAATGESAEAEEMLRAALAVTPDLEMPLERAGALSALGDAVAARDPAEARRLWEQALGLYRFMGVPEAAEVEARLRSAAGRGRMEA